MSRQQAHLDEVRHRRSELENHLIDEYAAGRIDRRAFVRRATTVGMSLPVVSFLVAACGGNDTDSGAKSSTGGAPVTRGGTLRAGTTVPGRALDPLVLGDGGAVCLVGQVGEYLSLSYGEPELRPVLAESWRPNRDASVWTFKIRQGVTFNDGSPMTAKDVAATFNRLADPKNGTNALEVLQGVLSSGGASAPDDTTVRFELDRPTGQWPWLASSDNSSAVILPAGYDGDWEKSFIGTGPWKLEQYTPKVRASFVRNDAYWGEKTVADRVEFTLYEDEVAMILALQAKNIEVLSSFGVTNGKAILDNSGAFKVTNLPSSMHRPMSMRVDRPPLDDKRVRQAIALCLNRKELVDSLLDGYGDLGNDSPFAPVFASTNPGVPQREQDLDKARQLLADAGHPDGFRLQVNVWNWATNPGFAQILQQSAKQIGIDMKLVIQDTQTFLGTGEFGSSPQLDSTAAVGDWGSRGVPNAFLTAQLKSDGVRNAAHWKSTAFDRLADDFMSESDVQTQQRLAGQMQELLLDETPVIYPFFMNYLVAMQPTVDGVVPTAMGHLLVDQASGAQA